MTVTYLRVRPAEMLAEPTAVSRRREGTTVLEMAAVTSAELAAANKAGLLVAATSIDGVETAGWVLAPEAAGPVALDHEAAPRLGWGTGPRGLCRAAEVALGAVALEAAARCVLGHRLPLTRTAVCGEPHPG